MRKRRWRGWLRAALHQLRSSIRKNHLRPRNVTHKSWAQCPQPPTWGHARCPPLYLVHPGLLHAGAQVLHAGVDVPLGLQLGFHARQVRAPLRPLQSHLEPRGSGQHCSFCSQIDTRNPPQVTPEGTNTSQSWERILSQCSTTEYFWDSLRKLPTHVRPSDCISTDLLPALKGSPDPHWPAGPQERKPSSRQKPQLSKKLQTSKAAARR